MSTMTIVAVVLIIIGVIALAYGGFSFTTKEKVAEIGPAELMAALGSTLDTVARVCAY